MTYIIPNTFAAREDTVRLSLLDQNFSSVATQINTLIGTVDLLGGGTTETFTTIQNNIAAVSSNVNTLSSNLNTLSSNGFKTGMIMMWSGSIATIPSGWVLCNGSNGTPDLRDRFIIGAGNSYNVAVTGGSKDAIVVEHNHGITDPGHFHAWGGGGTMQAGADNGGQSVNGQGASPPHSTSTKVTGITINNQGQSGTNANLPPYYALAFIMKT